MSNDSNKKDGFWLKESRGGEMGTHLIVMRNGRCVAHLYEDGQSSQDWEDLQAFIEGRESDVISSEPVQITLRRPI
jgi:hypothetical protein